MATAKGNDIKQIKLPVLDSQTGQPTADYTLHDVHDTVAREAIGSWDSTQQGQGGTIDEVITSIKSEIKGGTHFLGKIMNTISGDIVDGSHYRGPIYIEGRSGESFTAKAGDIVLNGAREFIWDGVAGTDPETSTSYYGTWWELGNQVGLRALAYKDKIVVKKTGQADTTEVVRNIGISNISTTPSTITKKRFVAGTLPSMSVDNETLIFSAGSLPSFSDTTGTGETVITTDEALGTDYLVRANNNHPDVGVSVDKGNLAAENNA